MPQFFADNAWLPQGWEEGVALDIADGRFVRVRADASAGDATRLGRWVLPASITYIGGKTGNYGEWDHESLFFYHRNTPYAIVLYTRGNFAPGNQLGCMMGGLFHEYCA